MVTYFLTSFWRSGTGGKRDLFKKLKPIKVRLPLLFVASYVIVLPIIFISMYLNLEKKMINEYLGMAKGAVHLLGKAVDADKVPEYLEKNFESEEYSRIYNYMGDIMESYPDILYMYVYEPHDEGGLVIFDYDEAGDYDEPGSIYEWDGAFIPYIDYFREGKQIPPLVDNTKYGYLLTYCEPLFNKDNKCACYVFVDFSMDAIHAEDMRLINRILFTFISAAAIVLFYCMYIIRKSIVGPIDRMSDCIKKFEYDTEEQRFNNIYIMENLNIRTDDEIETLYNGFMSVMKEGFMNRKFLLRAEDKIDELGKTAYKDALTGVDNKASYNERLTKLNEDIRRGGAKFAMVMVDVNNLKYVNDNFGHKEGDSYIKGSCAIISEVFMSSMIYRIGGDEFVVVLTGVDYENREALKEQAITRFMETYSQEDKEPWERYSASLGMGVLEDTDLVAEQVFNRADEAMYEYKMKFKEKYGSYR